VPFCFRCRLTHLIVCLGSGFALADGVSGSDQVVAPNEQAIADVRTGRTTTAKALWWGFDPKDTTRSLQAALNSRCDKLIVENMGRPWLVTTIELPSNKEVVFEPGVVVIAKRGEFLGKHDCLFIAKGVDNLALRGTGAVFRMHKQDYHRPPYESAEWRHALSFRGCNDVLIEGLTLSQSGGDGIYLGVGIPPVFAPARGNVMVPGGQR